MGARARSKTWLRRLAVAALVFVLLGFVALEVARFIASRSGVRSVEFLPGSRIQELAVGADYVDAYRTPLPCDGVTLAAVLPESSEGEVARTSSEVVVRGTAPGLHYFASYSLDPPENPTHFTLGTAVFYESFWGLVYFTPVKQVHRRAVPLAVSRQAKEWCESVPLFESSMRTLYFDLDGTVVYPDEQRAKPRLADGRLEQAIRNADFERIVCVGNYAHIATTLQDSGISYDALGVLFGLCAGAFADEAWFRSHTSLIRDPGRRTLHIDLSEDWYYVDDLAEHYFAMAHQTDVYRKHVGTRVLVTPAEGDGQDVLDWLRTARSKSPGRREETG